MHVSRNLVDLIERNADELTHRWLELVRTHPATPSYAAHDERELFESAFKVYSQLGKWLSRTTTEEEIAHYYTALGERRRCQGFALSEVIQALLITRRVLWFKVLADGFLDTALDLHLALELYNRVMLFFDRATYFLAVGYERSA